MTKIPPDDILEGLYKLRIRESEKLKTVLELGDLEIHQKKAGLDYQRLKTMVKRRIEQDLRNRNYGARNGNYDRNAVGKNQGTKQRGQGIPGDCSQWKANGQCSQGDNCSLRHDLNKRAKLTQPNFSPSYSTWQNERNASRFRSPRGKSPMSRWVFHDYFKGTCNDPFCEKWHPPECLFYKTKNVCRFGRSVFMRVVRLTKSFAKGLEGMVTKVHWLCPGWMSNAIERGDPLHTTHQVHDNGVAYFRIWSRRSFHRFCGRVLDIRKTIRCVKFTKDVARHEDIRDKKFSFGMIYPGDLHQRSLNAPEFEDRIFKNRQNDKSKESVKHRGGWLRAS